MPAADFIRVSYVDPHLARGRDILAAHPDVRALAGPLARSAAWVALLVIRERRVRLFSRVVR